MKRSTVLLIEDFPILAQYYQGILLSYFDEVIAAKTTSEALAIIAERPGNQPFDLAVLHEIVFAQDGNNYIDGFELALEIRERHPKTRLLYSVDRLSTYLIGSIIREINPEGLVFRPDLSEVEFVQAIKALKLGKSYHSNSIVPHMRCHIASSSLIDGVDRNILHFLGQGARTKDLPRLIALSLPSIEKRKKQLKKLLNDPESDYQLILAARKNGLI